MNPFINKGLPYKKFQIPTTIYHIFDFLQLNLFI